MLCSLEGIHLLMVWSLSHFIRSCNTKFDYLTANRSAALTCDIFVLTVPLEFQ